MVENGPSAGPISRVLCRTPPSTAPTNAREYPIAATVATRKSSKTATVVAWLIVPEGSGYLLTETHPKPSLPPSLTLWRIKKASACKASPPGRGTYTINFHLYPFVFLLFNSVCGMRIEVLLKLLSFYFCLLS